jgi:hypothetical protein
MSHSVRIRLITGQPSMIGGMVQNWSDEIDNRKLAADARHRRQTLRPTGHRHAQPQTAGSDRSAVPRRRILRPTRPPTGPLRDGAAASRRGRTGCHNRTPVRRLATDGLSSARRLRGGWSCRPDTQAAGAEARGAQADARGGLAYRGSTAQATERAHQRAGGGTAAHVWPHHSSPQPRAAACRQKKFPS